MWALILKSRLGARAPKSNTFSEFQQRLWQILWLWGRTTLMSSARRLEQSRTPDGRPMVRLSKMWTDFKAVATMRPNVGQATGRMLRHVRNLWNIKVELKHGVGSRCIIQRGSTPQMQALIEGFERGFVTSVKSLKHQRFLEGLSDSPLFPLGRGPVGVGKRLVHPPRPFFAFDPAADKRAYKDLLHLAVYGK